jgi:hypothetical protein
LQHCSKQNYSIDSQKRCDIKYKEKKKQTEREDWKRIIETSTRKTSETTTKRRDFINLFSGYYKGTADVFLSTVHTHYRGAAVKTFRMYGTFICMLSTCARCKIQTSQIATKEYLQGYQ